MLSAIVFGMVVVSAQAQSLQYRVKANIPFEFNIADRKLPSGKYSIGRARQNSDDTILSVADGNGQWKAVPSSHAVQTFEAKDKATLVFHRYGAEYFLYQVWIPGETTGREFSRSRSERELRRNLAAGYAGQVSRNTAVQTVTIVGELE